MIETKSGTLTTDPKPRKARMSAGAYGALFGCDAPKVLKHVC